MIFTDRSCRRMLSRSKVHISENLQNTFARALIKVQHLLSLSYSLSPLDYITTSAIINSSSSGGSSSQSTRLTEPSSGWTRLSWTRVAFTRSRCGRQSQLQAGQLERGQPRGGRRRVTTDTKQSSTKQRNSFRVWEITDKVGWLLDLWIHLAAQFKRNQNKSTKIHCENK